MNDLHDIETVIASRFPLLTIETLEERRVLDLLRTAALRNEWPLFQWDVVDGLIRGDRFNERVPETHDPDALHLHPCPPLPPKHDRRVGARRHQRPSRVRARPLGSIPAPRVYPRPACPPAPRAPAAQGRYGWGGDPRIGDRR